MGELIEQIMTGGPGLLELEPEQEEFVKMLMDCPSAFETFFSSIKRPLSYILCDKHVQWNEHDMSSYEDFVRDVVKLESSRVSEDLGRSLMALMICGPSFNGTQFCLVIRHLAKNKAKRYLKQHLEPRQCLKDTDQARKWADTLHWLNQWINKLSPSETETDPDYSPVLKLIEDGKYPQF